MVSDPRNQALPRSFRLELTILILPRIEPETTASSTCNIYRCDVTLKYNLVFCVLTSMYVTRI